MVASPLYLMDKEGRWTFSPAYDLTYSTGPNGEHQMDVCGEARNPTYDNLIELASKSGVKPKDALESIARVADVSKSIREFVNELPIREQTLKQIEKSVVANRERMARS